MIPGETKKKGGTCFGAIAAWDFLTAGSSEGGRPPIVMVEASQNWLCNDGSGAHDVVIGVTGLSVLNVPD